MFWRFIVIAYPVFNFFFWPNDIPLYGHITICYLVICWGTFGLFLHLAIVDNAVMNTCVCIVEYLLSISWGIYLGVAFLGHMVILHLTFLRNCKTITQWLHHFTFTPTMYKGSSFSTSLSTLVELLLIFLNFLLWNNYRFIRKL